MENPSEMLTSLIIREVDCCGLGGNPVSGGQPRAERRVRAHLQDVARAALGTHSFSARSSTLGTHKSSLHATQTAASSSAACACLILPKIRICGWQSGSWSRDLGDCRSALETSAAFALGSRPPDGQPREQKV